MHRRRRQIRCSYCYKTGHNKASCPKRKADMARKEVTDPMSWWLANEKAADAARSKRVCGYCGESGHNRKTCLSLKQDVALLEAKNQAWKMHVRDQLIAFGLGTGALIIEKHRKYNYEKRDFETQNAVDTLYLVLGFENWDKFNIVEKDRNVLRICEPKHIGNPDEHRVVSLPVCIRTGLPGKYDSSGRAFRVVAPAGSPDVLASLDTDWFRSSTSWTNRYFINSERKGLESWQRGYDFYTRKCKYSKKYNTEPVFASWCPTNHV